MGGHSPPDPARTNSSQSAWRLPFTDIRAEGQLKVAWRQRLNRASVGNALIFPDREHHWGPDGEATSNLKRFVLRCELIHNSEGSIRAQLKQQQLPGMKSSWRLVLL